MAGDAVILFEPDGYLTDGPRLMGRQAAGHAFLRAAVAGRVRDELTCATPHRVSADVFARVITALDPKVKPRWAAPGRVDLLCEAGTLYLPGPSLAEQARLRLRAGPAAYSLVGVTHTTASHTAMDAIAGLPTEPLAPWDALICTSAAVLATVRTVIEEQAAYLAWRLGPADGAMLPRLPVIPLGVHCADFAFSDAERRQARSELGIAPGEVVALFVGRLSYHAKAHPHAMYVGLEAAAKTTGAKLALVQCGWFANAPIEQAIKEGARRYAPSIKSIFTDGKDAGARNRSWAAADLFISLSDNVQETFGLAPVEAMAAGLPAIVTDWDGYKDTVRDGVDGYRIATVMPSAGHGAHFAAFYESGEATYDHYSGLVCRTVSVDLDALVSRLTELVASPAKRSEMGLQARSRARQLFDWTHVYRRYQTLYGELAEARKKALTDASQSQWLARAPKSAAARLDPFRAFEEYPTLPLGSGTAIALRPGASATGYAALARDSMFSYLPAALPDGALVTALLTRLGSGSMTIDALAEGIGTATQNVVLAAAVLAKMGLVRVVR